MPLRMKASRFASDEAGGGTIMGVFWFALLVGITGLAVDITDGYRTQTMLQSTADTSALAGAIALPGSGAVVSAAVANSVDNMNIETNGNVLFGSDVEVGTWNEDTRSFSLGGTDPDAVRTTVFRSRKNANAVGSNFLRIIGFEAWDVVAQAVAQRFIPDCLNDGLVARGIVDISSNNDFVNYICVHGQQGVEMQNHNYYETGVTVSMPDLDMLTIPAVGMTSNPGLPAALRENILDPRMVNHIDEIMAAMLDRDPDVLPAYIDPSLPVIVVNSKYKFKNGNYTPGRIYQVQCNSNKQVSISSGADISDIVIIAQCNISVGANASLSNVVLGSTALGNGSKPLDNANINFSANVDLGTPDNCTKGGGVQLFSSASIHFSSSMTINGLQVVAAGDVELGARDRGINGISVQSGQDITLTSNNAFGLCSGNAPSLFTVNYYRLVQ